ncbi:MAG: radical SAM protein [Candidatus Xenobiia bacterium LiM19]
MDFTSFEWIEGETSQGDSFYYFPGSMAVVEHDRHFGRLLHDLKRCDGALRPQSLTGYPEGYVEDTLFNLEILHGRGLLSEIVFPGIPGRIPAGRLIIANTMRCNLSCSYCYNRFNSSSKGISEADMSLETFQRCTEFLEEAGAGLPFLEVSFIGGEPLLNPGILDAAAAWRERLAAKGKELFITATTNATMLDSKMAEFCRDRVIHLKLTVDGSREEHDRSRVFPGGGGSYDGIAALLPEYFSTLTGRTRYAATTIDTRQSEPVERVETLSALGFNTIDLAELYSTGSGESADSESLEKLFRSRYEKLLDYLSVKVRVREYVHIIPVWEIVKNLHLRKPSFMRCRAGGDSFAVSSGGTVYVCHHFFGDERFALGNINAPLEPSRLSPYRIPVGERPRCRACWARLLCGGPCFHRSLAMTGDMFSCPEPECVRIRALILEVIRFYIRLRNEGNQSVDWFLEKGSNR